MPREIPNVGVVFCTDPSATFGDRDLGNYGSNSIRHKSCPARRAEHHRSFHFHSPFVWPPNYAAVSSVLTALLFAASGTAAQPTATPSARTWQSDGSVTNVQQIHDTQAVDGDTITLPTGTFTWSTKVTFTKAITLQGNTTTDKTNCSANDQTVLVENFPRSANDGMIKLVGNGGQRVTGITIRSSSTQMKANGAIVVQPSGTAGVRLDHIHFDHVYWSPMIGWYSPNFGVIDHCIHVTPVGSEGFVHCQMQFYGGQHHGDGAFMEAVGFGGPKFLFIEDNCAKCGADLTHGGKAVFRYNTFFNFQVGDHGTGMTFPDGRGGRAREIYNNVFHTTADHVGFGQTGCNGGSVLFHDNTFVDNLPGGGAITLGNFRTIQSNGRPFYGADGANAWDYNVTEANGTHVDGHPPYLFGSGTLSAVSGTTLTDSTKNWSPANKWVGYSVGRTPDGATAVIIGSTNNTLVIRERISQGRAAGNAYEIHKVLAVLDQPGLGIQTGIMNRLQPRWMQQAIEPCYSWNNVYAPNGSHLNFVPDNSGFTVQNIHYFNNTPMPAYTPYNYPHPLTTSLPPPQPRASVTLGSRRNFYKKEKSEARKARRKKWGHAKENLANEMTQPDQ
jgi:hypothetical protein